MKVQDIELAQAIVEHVDTHLHERMTLDDLVAATHYSKFHLHRAFTAVLGLPVHTYVQRRRLSEAASLLVHSRRSILDIALLSGYQSQQAFSLAFKSLYKQAPGAFRRRADAYPLQCRVSLYAHLAAPIVERQQVRLANDADVPAFLALMKAAIDGYPEMDEGAFLRPDDTFGPGGSIGRLPAHDVFLRRRHDDGAGHADHPFSGERGARRTWAFVWAAR